MALMMNHEQASELLGAWALHACDEGEGALVEAHLASCDECASEADRLRTAAAWLGTLTHRRAVDFVRREEASRRRAQREAEMAALPPDIEELATALALAEQVRMAVDALPADQQAAVRLAYFGGKTDRQVAEALGIPEGTAKSRLRMGLRRMAEALDREGVDQWQ